MCKFKPIGPPVAAASLDRARVTRRRGGRSRRTGARELFHIVRATVEGEGGDRAIGRRRDLIA